MKNAGGLCICLGLFLGFLGAMIPIQVVVAGTAASCGPPLVRVLSEEQTSDPEDQAAIDVCEDRSAERLPYAGGAVLVGVLVGGGLLLASRGCDDADQDPSSATRPG